MSKKSQKPEKMINFVATIESVGRVFHRSTCGWMKNVSMVNEIRFKDLDEAIKKGYQPCLFYRP
jgi:methylphosphotriester-DNA--protein-cysteine methyltransferase